MASKRDAQKWMERTLGKPTADAVFKKVDKMAEKGAATTEIEDAIADDLTKKIKTLVQKQVRYHVPRQERRYKGTGPRGPHK